ncbi:hypothetical protein ACH5RR_011763 [Cinchona calisaya]|uniref:AP complex mu/sigma subunit domain-containing protein n=1 Tax=Cinchona calisaya TaxID=153742 RepID=A0ABD3A8E2_9GENT
MGLLSIIRKIKRKEEEMRILMDIQCSLSPDEIAKVLNLEAMDKSQHWRIVGCSAYTGEGLLEGFDWLGLSSSFGSAYQLIIMDFFLIDSKEKNILRKQKKKMISAAMVINTLGKPRLSKFYDFQPVEKQHQLIRYVYAVLSSRPEKVSNFVEVESIFGQGTRLVYKHYATLYFVIVFDSSENELAMLDLIQVLVETLDKSFRNVCELDILFNYNKMQTILDEIIFGGQVIETNCLEVIKAAEEISKLETSSSGNTLLPRSFTIWRD